MKKVVLFLMVIALSVATLSAQQTSIEGSTTYGLFNNALDAAATIDESVTDLDFSTLGKDYLFAGIAGNPQKIANNGSNSTRLLLGYYKAAEKPWSVFTNISWTGTVNQGPYQVDDGVDTVTKYNYRLFNNLSPNATFLMNFGGFSSGLGLKASLTDDKALGSNYERTNSDAGTKEVRTAKDFTTVLNFFVPFFTQTNDLSHYAELNVGLRIVDINSSNYFATNGTASIDNETKNLSTTFSPSVFYKLSMPTEKLGTFYGSGRINLSVDSYSYENENNVSNFKTSRKSKFAPGFGANLTAGLRMEQSTDGEWLKFRLNPEAEYNLKGTSYVVGSTFTNITGDTVWKDMKDLYLTNSLDLSLRTAMEVKPEKWFVGLMLGATGKVGYENITRTQNPGKASGAANDGATEKTVKNNWTASANARFGIFIPLPNDYRFDIAVYSGENLLAPASLTMQLIVPLGKTTGF